VFRVLRNEKTNWRWLAAEKPWLRAERLALRRLAGWPVGEGQWRRAED
jgi:hypothetical protein